MVFMQSARQNNDFEETSIIIRLYNLFNQRFLANIVSENNRLYGILCLVFRSYVRYHLC